MIKAEFSFYDAIRSAGMIPPDNIFPGKIHRFPGYGKSRNNTAGWCLLFLDGLGGVFGDWHTDFRSTWQAMQNNPYSQPDKRSIDRRVKANKRAEKERNSRQTKAALKASTIWSKAIPAPISYPYLRCKGIQPYGSKLHLGVLTLPVMEFSGNLSSLQFISTDGCKRFLSGGRIKSCFIPVTDSIPLLGRLIITEGWATGCTLANDNLNAMVIAAIDAGNMKAVSLAARRHWPNAEIVIAGDDDRLTAGNPGATMARNAAIAADALLALPQWPENAPDYLTDFNDLALWLEGGHHG